MNVEVRIRGYCVRYNIQSSINFSIIYFYENVKEVVEPIYNENKKIYEIKCLDIKISRPTFIKFNDIAYELFSFPPNKHMNKYDVYMLIIDNGNIEKIDLEPEIGDYDVIFRFKIEQDILKDINKT